MGTSSPLDDVANAGLSRLGWLGGAASGAGILGAIGSGGTSLLFQAGVSILLGTASALFRKKPRPRRGRDLLRGLVDPTTYVPVVYGTQRVTGLRTFAWTTGNGAPGDARFLWVCAALCHGPIAGIDEIYLDGYLAVNTTMNAVTDILVPRTDFARYVTAWKGYGTDGQLMYHPRTNPRTITGHAYKNSNERTIDFSTPHGYLVGDTIAISGTSGLTDGPYFVQTVDSTTRVTIGLALGGGLGSVTGLSGSADYYNPDLPAELPGQWTSGMKGAGVAFVLLRLVYDEIRFPGGIPEIEAVVRGSVVEDTRSPATGTVTTSAVSATGVPRHASAALVTESVAHGLVAGDTIEISGHSDASLNGIHRVFDVPSATTYRLPCALAGAGTGGTRTKFVHSTNPALCLRDFLRNGVYGAAVTTAELDEAGFQTEATYHDTPTDVPIVNGPAYDNIREVTQIVVSGGTATATVTPAHHYVVGDRVTFSGFRDEAGGAFNNATFTILTTPLTTTFTFATVVANGTYHGDVREERNPRKRSDVSKTSNTGLVRAVTPGVLFSTNGIADPSQPVQQTIEELLSSCRGLLIYQSGVFRLTTPRATTPHATFALTDDTIIGEVRLVCPGQADVANVVSATFPNVATNYQQDTVAFPGGGFNDLLAGDNYQWLRKEIELPFTSQPATAEQICMVTRRESRARVLQCVATEAALLAQPGDVVNVTREAWGLSVAPFRVLLMAGRPDDTVELTLIEHDDSWYDLDPGNDVSYYDHTPPTPHFPPLENFFLRDFRRYGIGGTAGPASLDSGLSLGWQTFTGPSRAQINISAHVLRIPISDVDYLDVSYNAGTISLTGTIDRDVPLYIYCDDPTYAGGAVSYAYTTTKATLQTGSGRRWLGTLSSIPSAGAPLGPVIEVTAPRSYKEVD